MRKIFFISWLSIISFYANAQMENVSLDNQNLDSITPVGKMIVGNGYNMTNSPFGNGSYWNILSMRHGNPNNDYTTQIAGEFFGNRLAFRNTQNTLNRAWNEIYHSGNIADLKTALGQPLSGYTLTDILTNGNNTNKSIAFANANNLGLNWSYNSDFASLYYSNSVNGSGKLMLDVGDDDAPTQGFQIRSLRYDGLIRNVAYFQANGNIGIGTANPTSMLDIYGTNKRVAIGNENVFLDLGQWDETTNRVESYGRKLFLTSYTDGIAFGSNGQQQIAITPEGRLGIGITVPTAKLEVNSSMDYDQLSLIKNTLEGDKGAGLIFKNVINDGSLAEIAGIQAKLLHGGISQVSGSLSLYTKYNASKIEAVTINPQGDMGIGTTTPREKLSVNGKIRAHEIKVETANWPDYVFEEGYKVGTLEELEGYIKANKRLPEIPSAKEVDANGVELGEMNKLLLKKVEELTLMLIDQNKKNEKQEQAIDELRKELEKVKSKK